MPSFLHSNLILCLTAHEHELKCASIIAALICRTVKHIVLKQQINELPYKLGSSAMHLGYMSIYMSICSRIRLKLLFFWESFSTCYIHSQHTGNLGLLLFTW